jgi:23S rRNA (cytidine1920-2'-O)/16S rRNA (cytidine1409-2'-O)-methyltransferase
LDKRFVSRAALKLASVVEALKLDFQGKTVLDVGSSTGGFTDYVLRHRAIKVIAVEVGTNQLHPDLRGDSRVELHEKTDIRTFRTTAKINIALIDVSFISLRDILPAVARLTDQQTAIVAMVKPQFEAGQNALKHRGVIKNNKLRRDILKEFENWTRQNFVILGKADSAVTGLKGNRERFYLLRKL